MGVSSTHPTLTFASLNVNGLGERGKRLALFGGLQRRVDGVDVMLLQETHHDSPQQAEAWEREGSGPGRPWRGRSVWVAGGRASRGVAVLVGEHVPVEGWRVDHVSGEGRVCVVSFSAHGQRFRVGCVYAPCMPGERVPFFQDIMSVAIPPGEEGVMSVVGGDWNCIADVTLDQSGGGRGRCVGYGDGMSPWMDEVGLVDVFRDRHPSDAVYTHFSASAGTAARLDRLLVGGEFVHSVTGASMSGVWPGDHVAVLVRVEMWRAPLRGPGGWAFPRRLLADEGFVDALRGRIGEWLVSRIPPGKHSPGDRWEVLKALIASFTRDHCQRGAARARVGGRCAPWDGPGDGLRKGEVERDVGAWREGQAARLQGAREEADMAGLVWEEFGETSSAYFFRQGRERARDTTIWHLAPGIPQCTGEAGELIDLSQEEGVREARGVLAGYFDGDRDGSMFAPRVTDECAQQCLLAALDRRLSVSDVASCEGGEGGCLPTSGGVPSARVRRVSSQGSTGCRTSSTAFFGRWWGRCCVML